MITPYPPSGKEDPSKKDPGAAKGKRKLSAGAGSHKKKATTSSTSSNAEGDEEERDGMDVEEPPAALVAKKDNSRFKGSRKTETPKGDGSSMTILKPESAKRGVGSSTDFHNPQYGKTPQATPVGGVAAATSGAGIGAASGARELRVFVGGKPFIDPSGEGKTLIVLASARAGKSGGPGVPVSRSGRAAAQKANERIIAKQEIVVGEQFVKKELPSKVETPATGSKSAKGSRKKKQEDDDEGVVDAEEENWAQCDNCSKWRLLQQKEKGEPGYIDFTDLPDKWFCNMNIVSSVKGDGGDVVSQGLRKGRCEDKELTVEGYKKERKAERDRNRREREEMIDYDEDGNPAGGKSPRRGGDKPGGVSPRPCGGKKRKGGQELEGGGTAFINSHKKGASAAAAAAAAAAASATERASQLGGGSSSGLQMAHPTVLSVTGEPVEDVQWVQCEKCQKWRRLPPNKEASSLPDKWFCKCY